VAITGHCRDGPWYPPVCTGRVEPGARAPAQDPPAQEGVVPQFPGYPPGSGGWLGEPPLRIPSVLGTGGAGTQPRPCNLPLPPPLACRIKPNQCADRNETPRAQLMWKPWLRSTNPTSGGVACPRWIRVGRSPPQGPDLRAWYPNHQPQHQQQLSRPSGNNLPLPEQQRGSFSNPGATTDCASAAQYEHRAFNWI